MAKFLKYFPIVKVDVAQRMVYGLVTAERKDKDGETCHYESTKAEYKTFIDEMSKMSGGDNIMPLREMHQLHAVGAGKTVDFNDDTKEIRMGFKVIEESTWQKVLEKVLLAFSQGGRYAKKWKDGSVEYFTSRPGEVSLVDNPCLAGAVIEYVKADGSIEMFKVPEPAIVRLSEADVDRLAKALSDSILGTHAKDFDAAAAERVRQMDRAKGATMKPEQIKKCADALGMSEADFLKMLAESDLEKAKKGMAALHGHLEKAHAHAEDHVEHIEKCMKACKDVMGDESKKALQSLIEEFTPAAPEMVSLGKTADGVELFRKASDKELKLEELTKGAEMKPEDLQKAIADGIKAATEPLLKRIEEMEKQVVQPGTGPGVRFALVDRDGKILNKADSADARNPMAVS